MQQQSFDLQPVTAATVGQSTQVPAQQDSVGPSEAPIQAGDTAEQGGDQHDEKCCWNSQVVIAAFVTSFVAFAVAAAAFSL